ncbi:MAG TPA: alanine--tRNA ligase-related protein, partial [Methylomirabilota bacterium]|nr:alanine--tRNA ligase-related protein [Methylomirabilota bacterium]
LPRPSIDTGAGLERLAAVLQDKISNYDTDLFLPLTQRAAELCGVNFEVEKKLEAGKGGAASLRVVADHSRATAFLIADGVVPSNEGRGYVLRKIMRRAIRHGRLLGLKRPVLLIEMVHRVRSIMRGAYRELDTLFGQAPLIGTEERQIRAEEHRFSRTIEVGLDNLEELIRKQKEMDPRFFDFYLKRFSDPGDAQTTFRDLLPLVSRPDLAQISSTDLRNEVMQLAPLGGHVFAKVLDEERHSRAILSGDAAFRLYDTFGLPRDFVEDACHDAGVPVDWDGFEHAMNDQRTRSKASWKGAHKEIASPVYAKLAEIYRTGPNFYFESLAKDCRIEAIVTKLGAVNELAPGTEAEIVLDRTAFYAESGGQVADVGTFWNNEQSLELAEVRGAYYPVSGLIAHRIVAKETLRVGDRIACVADGARRERIKRNHTATHLMHAALRNILGTHVKQAGSLVAPDRLRFDFSHFAAVDPAELHDIEDQVNDQIRTNAELATDLLPLDEALASGALAFFGDRYPEQNVRVVTIPDANSPRGFYSKELCGGTHVRRSGEVGIFKVTVEQASSAGVRRIEAITGAAAVADYQRTKEILAQLSGRFGVTEENLAAALERNEESQRQLEKQFETLKRKSAHSKLDELLEQVREVKGVKVLSAEIENADRETLRQLSDSLRQKLGSGVVVLGAVEDGPPPRVALLAGVTKDLTARLHAGKIAQELAPLVGGKGGGRPDLAEAGGKDTSALKKALLQVVPLLERML